MFSWRRVSALAALALTTAVASAQSLTGSFSGTVRDELGAVVPGASVEFAGNTGTLGTVSDEHGTFRFAALAPGLYTLTVRKPSFEPRIFEGLAVRVGAQLVLDVVVKVAGLEESLEVTEGTPVVDVASASTSNALSSDLLFNLPIGRDSGGVGLLNYTPGVNSYSAFGGGQGTANAILLDGVDTRESWGGFPWNFFNYNLIQEVEVQGIGAPAEYGGFTGAVVNTVTRSGGNHSSALVEARYSGAGLGSNNVSAETAGQNPALADPVLTKKLIDLTAQVSGPLVKDRFFYFVNFQHYERVDDPSGQVTRIRESEPRFNTKLTFQDGTNDNLSLMLQYDDFNLDGVPVYALFRSTDELTSTENGPEFVWNLQWRHVFGAKTFLEAKYVGWTSYDSFEPKVKKPGHYDGATGAYSVSAGQFFRQDLDRNQIGVTLSRHADDFLGTHDFKFGLEIGRGSQRDRFHYVDDIFYYDYGGAPYQAYGYTYDIRYRNKRDSVFAQDSWRVSPRLTLNLGLRFDWIRGGNDEIGDPYDTKCLGPRLGLAFDLSGDKTTVLKASWSRYYETAVASYYYRSLPGFSDYVVYDNTGSELVEIDRVPAVLYPVANEIRHPRTDELAAGVERAFGKDVRLGLTLVARWSGNFVNSVYPHARFTPVEVQNLLTAAPLTLYQWENREASQGNPLITNPDGLVYRDPTSAALGTADAYRHYQAAMLVLSRRFSGRWQAQASYVLSRAQGTVDNTGMDFSNVGLGSQFEQPSRALVNTDGLLSLDFRHEVKLLGTYQVPKVELALSAILRSQSGQTYTPVQRISGRTLGLAGGGVNVLLEPRGSRRLPSLTTLDLRAEKIFKVAGKHRLAVYADILNALNAGTPVVAQTQVPSIQIEGIEQPIEFGAPTRLPPARQVVLGARWSF